MRIDAATRAAALKEQAVMNYFGIGDDDIHVDILYKLMFKMQTLESSYKWQEKRFDEALSRIRKLEDGKKDKWCK